MHNLYKKGPKCIPSIHLYKQYVYIQDKSIFTSHSSTRLNFFFIYVIVKLVFSRILRSGNVKIPKRI